MTAPVRLRLSGIRKDFGATRALRRVSLELAAGETLALIGENGAGKSTLMKILSGALEADAGTMELNGARYAPRNPNDARRLGVAMIYQELNLALHLSAQQNILLGAETACGGWLDPRANAARARSVLDQLGYAHLDLSRPAGSFSIAEQQLLEIARALLGSPQVLIMDEPTSSLTQADTEKLFAAITRLHATGVSIIYISHFLEECRRVAQRFTVLKDGETVGSGEMDGTTQSTLISLMTGRPAERAIPSRGHSLGEVVLECRDLTAAPRLKHASFSLRAGEIFGVAGLVGSGRTEMLRAIFGLDQLETGDVVLGEFAGRARPLDRWRSGCGFLSEDRKEEGLMLTQSLAENVSLPKLEAYGAGGWVDESRQLSECARWISSLRIKCSGPAQAATELSGGNQQKVALARLLAYPARILLLDEPTRGIDIGSKTQIYELISALAAEGRAVVVASSHLPELLGLCDTIGVMCRGRLAEIRPRSDWTEADIMRVATGTC
jgi:ribose transport system ATP-binding protein